MCWYTEKSKIETGDMPSFENFAGKSRFNARSVYLVMMSALVMIPMLHAKRRFRLNFLSYLSSWKGHLCMGIKWLTQTHSVFSPWKTSMEVFSYRLTENGLAWIWASTDLDAICRSLAPEFGLPKIRPFLNKK